jgi:hypothetical protein
MKAYTYATAADSVAVNTPEMTPPMMMTAMMKNGMARSENEFTP